VKTAELSLVYFEETAELSSIVFQRVLRQTVRNRAAQEEALIRRLLGLWVSELEPCIVRNHGTGKILGLGMAGDPSGRVIVRADT
jgi:hypothetical protein